MSTLDQMRVLAAMPIVMGWGAQTVGKAPIKNGVVASSLAFAALHYLTETNFRVFQMAQKLRGVHTLARVATLTWSSGYLLLELSKRVSFLPITAVTVVYSPRTSVVASWVGMIGGFYLAGKVVEYINQYSNQGKERLDELAQNDEELKSALKTVKVEWQRGNDELMDQWLLVLEIVVGTALVVFSDAKLTFAAQLAANLYTLKQITQRSWLLLSREFWQESHSNIRIKFGYQPIFFRDYSKKPTDECSICLEVPEKRYYFCDNHSYDQVCLTSLFIKEMAKFRIVNQMLRMSHIENGREVGATYNVYAREDEKPKCPECRQIPSQNRLYVRVWDKTRREYCWGDVTWLNYQPQQKVKVNLTESEFIDDVQYVSGRLQDGSDVYLEGDQSMVEQTCEVKILSVGVNNGRMVLKCQSDVYENKKMLRLQGLVALDPAQQHLLNEYNRVKKLSERWIIEELVGNDCWVMDGDDYDDVASAPAVVQRLEEIATLINPEILKPLVAQEFHHEINSTYFDLMDLKNHWQHPENWIQSDSE